MPCNRYDSMYMYYQKATAVIFTLAMCRRLREHSGGFLSNSACLKNMNGRNKIMLGSGVLK